MSGNTGSWLSDRLDPDATRSQLSTFRMLALGSALVLIWSFMSVFYELVVRTNVAGGASRLFMVTAITLVAATVAARFVPVRAGLGIGAGLLAAGVGAYLLSVPDVLARATNVAFVLDVAVYLTGITVLNFLNVGLWATVLSPAPVFACWYLAVRRQYGLAALVGGLALGFFALTNDATRLTDAPTTLIGSLSALGLLAFGGLERAEGTWRQVEQAAIVGLLGLVAARLVTASGNAVGPVPSGGNRQTLEASLINNDETVAILGSISLSPEVRFTVEATEGTYWRVGAHDRYTGDSWLRTGEATDYDGFLGAPVGESRRIEQTYEVQADSRALPAAWKPTEVGDAVADAALVTPLGGLRPSGPIEAGTEYTVVSRAPTASVGELRDAGTDYPDDVEQLYLRVPNSTPDRVGNRAAAIVGDADTPYAKVSAIQRWLVANRGYSLDISRPNGDIVDGFLFSMEKGYCVYFATAMAVMLRTVDVPARFVTGYTTGQEIDDGEWVVRGYNSHAWVEVYFPGIGWVSFDPTPASPRREAQQQSLERARLGGDGNVDVPGSRQTATPTPTETPTPTDTPTPTETPTPTDTPTPTETTPGDTPGTPTDTPATPTDLPPGNVTGTPPDGNGGPAPPDDGTPPSGNGTAGNASATPTANAPDTPGGANGEGGLPRVLSDRDRVTIIGGAAALVLGVHHFDAIDRVSRELWLRGQNPTDSPAADAERAFARVEHLLGRRYRERGAEETPRQYLDGIDVTDGRVRRLAAIYERAHYAGTVTREDADEAIRIANEVIGGD